MSNPYVGVTGFTSRLQVEMLLGKMPENSNRRLMVGVLLSHKTLQGVTNKWPNRYPQPDKIAEIFPSHPLAFNLIHYHTKESKTLFDQLRFIIEQGFAGPNCHGFQLNVAWPNPQELNRFRAIYLSKWIVLRVGERALEMVDYSPEKLADKVEKEYRTADYILLDQSGGFSKPLDKKRIERYLRELKARNLNVGLGTAGGLSPRTLGLVKALADEFPELSIDVESGLRNQNDD